MQNWERHVQRIRQRYQNLSNRARYGLLIWITLQFAFLGLLWWYTPKRLFENLASWANELRDSATGWLWLVLVISLTSFPPMIGWTTTCIVSGFGFGFQKGFLVAVCGTLIGSMTTFTVARSLLSRYAKKLMEQQTTMRALGSAIASHGLPLICLVRLCPFPYSYSNFFFASLHEVSSTQFFIANLALSLKILLHVYVGTRLYLFSDPETRHEMDSTTKIINGVGVAVSLLLAVGVGGYVYRVTMAYVAEGQVHLIEDDLEAFLEEEARLDNEVAVPLDTGESGPQNTNAPTGGNERLPRHSLSMEDDSTAAWDGAFSDFDGERRSLDVSRSKSRP